MKTEYATEVLMSIKSQEFFEEVEEYVDSELFDDIMDFMQHYCPDWYLNLGEWASEFVQQQISNYIDLYDDPETPRIEVLESLYMDLDQQYQSYLSSYETTTLLNEAYSYRHNFDDEVFDDENEN